MDLFLIKPSALVAPGHHAVLLLDQAGWHVSSRLIMLPNVAIPPLLASCPELNPQENVLKSMCENWLSNPVFKVTTTLVTAVSMLGASSSKRRDAPRALDCATGHMGFDQGNLV